MKKISFILLFGLLSIWSFTQEPDFAKVTNTEMEISSGFERLFSLPDSPERDSLNEILLNHLSSALSSWDSFFYNWDKLKYVGNFRSPDNRVRVFTWYLESAGPEYHYYGLIQHLTGNRKKKQEVEVFGLTDRHRDVKNPETVVQSDTSNWLGYLCYGIHSFRKRKNTWYVLFGYEYPSRFSQKKLLDVLTFDRKGEPVFGGNFVLDKKRTDRFILEYSADVVISLRYNPHLDMIVFDHLEPMQPILEGNYRFYNPDGSFDGLTFDDGKFILEKDVDARNY